MNIPFPVDNELDGYINLLTEDKRAGRLHVNLRYLLAFLPEPDYRSGMPADYPQELSEDISILLRLLEIAALERNNSSLLLHGMHTDLQKVVHFLVTSIRPQKIFLLPHPPMPDETTPFTELIIVMPDSSQKPYSSLEQVIDLGCIHNRQVHSIVLRTADLNKKIADGDLYYCTVCNLQRLVYDDGKTTLPEVPVSQLKAMQEKARAVFAAGYAKAAGFLDAASLQQHPPVAAFMLQQVAELTYRTTTLALTGFDPRSHSFEALRKHARRCAPELNSILPADGPNDEKMLQILESAYLNARYNDSFHITPEILLMLTERVTYLHQRSRFIFEHQLQTLFIGSLGQET
jgi:HEPN domain-containing protein